MSWLIVRDKVTGQLFGMKQRPKDPLLEVVEEINCLPREIGVVNLLEDTLPIDFTPSREHGMEIQSHPRSVYYFLLEDRKKVLQKKRWLESQSLSHNDT